MSFLTRAVVSLIVVSAIAAVALPSTASARPEPVTVSWMTRSGEVHEISLPNQAAATQRLTELKQSPRVLAADVARTVRASASDPFRPLQWHLDHIRAEKARTYGTGSGVTVAVLDTGVDTLHPDLAAAVLPGYDAVDGTTSGQVDLNGHGTHVAGIVAAITGNDTGVASLGSGAKILPVRVLDPAGNGSTADVAEGVVWATNKGADIINLSLGGPDPDSVLREAMKYARSKGVAVMAASGNEASSVRMYPAAWPEVVGVTATDEDDRLLSVASTGWWVDLAAPGVGILSTWPGGTYAYSDGTSMAAPIASALAALLLARDPTLRPDQVRSRLIYNSTDIGPSGRDATFGFGRLHAAATMLPPQAFTDVGGLSHTPHIWSLAETRITKGCGPTRYCPDRRVTRAEMATFLTRALRLAPSTKRYFTDTAGSIHERNISAIYEAGITVGCGDKTTFCPDAKVSRAEMATFLSRALGLAKVKKNHFDDVDPGSSHAGFINAIYKAGITTGCKDKTVYCPNRSVTRAEMATFLARSFRL